LGLAGWLRAFWWDAGRESEGLAWFARLLALPALAGRTAQRAAALDHSGALAFKAGDLAAARRFVAEGLAIHREVGAKPSVLASLLHLSSILRYGDDIAVARPPLVEALSLAQVPGMEAQRAAVLINLGQVATLVGDGAEARRCFAEALPVFLQREQVTPLPFVLENLAALAAADGEPARALRLASAAARQRRLFELPDLAPHLRAGLGDFQERARAALGREAAQTAWTAGQTLSLEQALAGGLEGGGDS
jgi:ATP/maltotriose-dependent transcriptional regulator MalT